MNAAEDTTVTDSVRHYSGVMLPTSGKGKEICEYLRAALSIPERATTFEVRFAVGEIITVKCEYMPTDPSTALKGSPC